MKALFRIAGFIYDKYPKVIKVEALPKLGTGKADFKGAKKLAGELSDANT